MGSQINANLLLQINQNNFIVDTVVIVFVKQLSSIFKNSSLVKLYDTFFESTMKHVWLHYCVAHILFIYKKVIF